VPLVLAHGLVGATIVAAVHPQGHRWKPLLLGAGLAICPDIDFALLWGLGMQGVHRSFTHSFAFAIAATAVTWLITDRRQWREVLACGLALASHGVLDFLAAKNATGIMFLWPFSGQRFKLGVWGFAEMSPGMPAAELLYWSAWEAVIFVPMFAAVFYLRRRLVPRG
jgi:membrane-bound metal-dependent hydrolase YbcI (DUF457 family)